MWKGVKSRHATCTHRIKVRVDKTSFIGRKRRVVHEVSEDAIEILDSMWGNHVWKEAKEGACV